MTNDEYGTRVLLCYLVRGIMAAASKDRLGSHRWKRRSAELATALVPMAVSERSTMGFARALASRFLVDLAGNDEHGPVELRMPSRSMRWDHAAASIRYRDMRSVLEENPAFVAQFALAWHANQEDAAADHELLVTYQEPEQRTQNAIPLPGGAMLSTKCYWTTWTLLQPLSHGADEKSGNVTMFRRQREVDPITGSINSVPFISGNAVRGAWRDMAFSRWLALLGLQATDIPPARAHALLAGGSVEAGSDTGAADPVLRREARDVCPPWDLFAGCIDQQIMGGRLQVHDATLVCSETAWRVARMVAPGVDAAELARSLPEAAECTSLRLGTRQAHRDLDESDGSQMLFNVEHLIPGCRMVHSLRLVAESCVSDVARSCLADLLAEFARTPVVGARLGSGFGSVAFDGYVAAGGATVLPSPDGYLAYVSEHRESMREWALRGSLSASDKRGGKRGKRAA